MEKEEAKKVLKSSWVMTTGHTLDKNNAELKEAIETILNQEEEECLHCGKGKASYCENCYQELIGINAKLQTTINKYKENALFICNPDKNTKCKKTNCYINGGDCNQTTDIAFMKEKEKTEIIAAIDKGNGEDETGTEQFILILVDNIKQELAEAEAELKLCKECRQDNKPIQTHIKIVKLLTKIEICKKLLKEEK